MTVSIDGARLTATALDTITTPTGTWPVSDLGEISGGHVYQFGLTSRPEWWSVCIVRYPIPGDTSVGERIYPVSISGVSLPVSVLAGATKCVDNGEPIAPSMQRIRDAVAAKRVLPYSAAAFAGWPKTPALSTKRTAENLLGYQPGRIYGRSSSNNSIAYTIAGAAGEYGTSRGFLSSDDAVMIAAAMAGDSTAFGTAAGQNRTQLLYGLSIPYLTIWSQNHHSLRDPQNPLSGDKPYINEGTQTGAETFGNEGKWCAPADYPYLSALNATAGICYSHVRDEAHLLNHGYAYWLATGDPRAALLQQAIAAYALASVYQGRYSDGRYRTRFNYQRTTMNMWSAMWKAQDVANNLTTANGNIFWPRARAQKMVDDVLRDWRDKLAKMDAATDKYSKSSSIFRGVDLNADSAYSNFMIQGYGLESAYLFASQGRPEMLRRIAENFVMRFGAIGGTRGFYGNGSGSGFKLLASDGSLPYSDAAGLVAWTNAGNTYPNTTFNGSPVHYVIRGYWALKLSQDAVKRGWLSPVAGLDDAIAKTEAARAATTSWANTAALDWKHAGVPFQ